ncbi:MAG: ATP-grasp domain-containing protein [Nitrospira sp.]|nr:ATP-grasp domain-containing protein [Nitrospira sp.]
MNEDDAQRDAIASGTGGQEFIQRWILEQHITFERELSVLVVRDAGGQCRTYPAVDNQHERGILRLTLVPSSLSAEAAAHASRLAIHAVSALNSAAITPAGCASAPTLEAQSVGPFTNPIEHGFANYDVMNAKMMKMPGYRKLFKQVFGDDNITTERVGMAIASFQRTVLSGNSPADRFDQGGEAGAISEAAQKGLILFREKARCTKCHSGFNFTDEKFHNLGIGWDDNKVDLGRYLVTGNAEEIGAFKTPTLREIARSAPYMHDGRFKTLAEVVDFYNKGGVKNPHQDNLIIPLDLTDQEKRDVVEFLRTLNGEGWQHVSAPKSFPN